MSVLFYKRVANESVKSSSSEIVALCAFSRLPRLTLYSCRLQCLLGETYVPLRPTHPTYYLSPCDKMDSAAVSAYLLFPPPDHHHPQPGMGHGSTRMPPPNPVGGSYDDGRERGRPGAAGIGTGRGHAASMSSWQPLTWSEPLLATASLLAPSRTLPSE